MNFSENGLIFLPKVISLYLNLNWNEIGDEGLLSLVRTGLSKTLVNFYLNLEWNEISPLAFKALIYKGIFPMKYLTKCQLNLSKY